MSFINLSIQHGATLEDARKRLESSVSQACSVLSGAVHTVNWSADRSQVKLVGIGFEMEMQVDASAVHVRGDVPFLSRLLGGTLATTIKGIIEKNFPKRLN